MAWRDGDCGLLQGAVTGQQWQGDARQIPLSAEEEALVARGRTVIAGDAPTAEGETCAAVCVERMAQEAARALSRGPRPGS